MSKCPFKDLYCGLNGRCGRCVKASRPLIEVIGDDHPDQPRFDGGVIGVVIAAAILWAIAGALIWWATR